MFVYYPKQSHAPKELGEKSANAAATAEPRHITYHKVSQSHLPTLGGVDSKLRGGRNEEEEEEVVGMGGSNSRGGRFWGGTSRTKVSCAPQCADAVSLSRLHGSRSHLVIT